MVISHNIKRFFWHLNWEGPAKAIALVRFNLGLIVRAWHEQRWDERFNVETGGRIALSRFTCNGDQEAGNDYEPTPLKVLKQVSAMFPTNSRDFTFVDFGSGKGRMCIFASSYPFKRIIGVEFAKELSEVATANFGSLRNSTQRCFNLSSACIDAADFQFPDGPCVLYFFNPFKADLMERVLDGLTKSLEAQPRKIILLYLNPENAHLFNKYPLLRRSEEMSVRVRYAGSRVDQLASLQVYETL